MSVPDDFTLISIVGMFADVAGSIIAISGTAEKGALNTRVTVTTLGGHSSVPPSHTVRLSIKSSDKFI